MLKEYSYKCPDCGSRIWFKDSLRILDERTLWCHSCLYFKEFKIQTKRISHKTKTKQKTKTK
jgi:DNA-directed RNA polymerase subunit RPC12/RpoP